MRVVVLLFRFYTFYSFCIVLTENIFYFSNHTKNYDVDNVFFLISWDWSNTCYNAKVTTIQLCDPSALLSHLQRLRHKRQKETFSTVTFFFFFFDFATCILCKNEMRWPLATGEANLWLVGISLPIANVSWGVHSWGKSARKCQNIRKLWVNRLRHFGANLLRMEAVVSICLYRLHW